MSLRSRARNLQRITNLTYQQALLRLRELGDKPAQLARQNGWPLARCDAHLVMLEDRAKATPWPRGPGLVHGAEQLSRARTVGEVCTWLLDATGARTVVLVDREGRRLADAGEERGKRALFLLSKMRSVAPKVHAQADTWLALICAQLCLEDAKVHGAETQGGARLQVIYDGKSSLGLVQLRVAMAVAEIGRKRMIAEPEVYLIGDGVKPGEGSSGAPAQISAFDGIVGRGGKIGQA